jgi:hypothetical protein
LALAAIVASVGIWFLWKYDPNAPNNAYLPCIFRELTGYYCIGCGMTRAMHALVHGDIAGALAMNPLAVLLIPLIPLMVASSNGWKIPVLEPIIAFCNRPALWLVLLPAYWIARNLPWFPFTLLAPG